MKKAHVVHSLILFCIFVLSFSLSLAGCALSSQTTALQQVASPTFFPPAGTYPGAQLVNISTTTAGATTRYTTDGSTPTRAVGTIYSAPISVSASETIKVIAYESGWADSAVVAAVYAISGSVAAPIFSPAAGTYANPQSVTVSTSTAGASIRFTTDGSAPTETIGTVYSTPLVVATSETINAIAYRSGWLDSTVSTAAYSLQAATPAFSLAAGTYSSDQSVAISCSTLSAVIHYTTDGSPPTGASATYSAPIPLAGSGTSKTVKAIATMTGMTDSLVASAAFVINYSQVSTPNLSPAGGTYTSDQSVVISCATPGATIHYTTDNSTPSASSPTYAAPISVAGSGTTATIKAYALKAGMTDSSVGAAIYIINYVQVSTPAFDPVGGTHTNDQSVAISSATPGATIHYTTDNSTPSASSPTYFAPISVAGNGTTKTIKAYAVKAGMTDSNVEIETYVISYLQVSTPAFSPAAGTYTGDQSVTIASATFGAVIYYTTDNSLPTRSSAVYASAISVAGNGTNRTIRAFATNAGMTDSSAASAAYTISYLQVSTPAFSPLGGIFSTDQSVTISSATSGATIHYTTDGSAPTAASATYSAPIPVAGNGTTETIRAMAINAGMTNSIAAAATYVMFDTWQTIGAQGGGIAQFHFPKEVAVDASGHIYVADASNNRIVRMDDMSGANWTSLGSYGNGANQFSNPFGVAVDGTGRIYVADASNNRIVRMDDMTGTNWTALGSPGTGINQFIAPTGIVVDASGHIYTADQNSRIVRMDDMNGTNWNTLGSLGTGIRQFNNPIGLALDASGHIYIADSNNNRIVRMNDMSGAGWITLGSSGSGINQFNNPWGIAVDATDSIYVADGSNSRIVRFMIP